MFPCMNRLSDHRTLCQGIDVGIMMTKHLASYAGPVLLLSRENQCFCLDVNTAISRCGERIFGEPMKMVLSFGRVQLTGSRR